ncbi:hypothetical protein D9M73_272500 [compost metagenome]
MALAAGRGQQQVMLWYQLPPGLMQVLTDVLGMRMIGRMPLHGFRPMVGRPENLDACGARAGAPSAEAGE